MSAKKSDTPDGAISGRVPLPFKLNKQLLGKAAIAVIVLIGLVLGGRIYVQNRQQAAEAEFQAVTKLANSLSFQRKYDEAATQLKNYIAESPKKEYEFEATIHLGSVYLNWSKYQEAMTAFRAADELNGPNPLAAAVGIALAAERLGDKATAIQAYNNAIEILEPKRNEGYVAEDITYYQAKVQALEEQP